METSALSSKANQTLSQSFSSISFVNPDGSKVDIGKNDCKNVRIEYRDGVLWVSEIK